MGITRFPHGISSFGVPIYGGGGFGSPLGIGCGDVKYVVAAKASTDLYYEKLRKNGIEDGEIFTTVAAAEDDCTAAQNDVVAVLPGAHLESAELDWDKDSTHLIGLGGINTNGDWSEPNVVIYTTGTAVANTIHVTGKNCQFMNFTVSNYGNNAVCLTPFKLDAYGCYFANVTFQGNMTTNQNTTVAANSLDLAGGAMYPIFDNCTIGQDVWGGRSGANSGQLRFTGTVQPNGIWFRGCRIVSISNTATCAAVALPANGAVGRGLLFQDCVFQNLHTSHTDLTHVFYDNDDAGQTIMLKNCAAMGYSQWQSKDRRIFADMPITGTGGGLCLEPTAGGGS